jgi:gas vesicle protein
MEKYIEESTYDTNNIKSVLLGLLVGSLTGATAMLLFAPQSGKRTRTQIHQEGIELRDQTTTGINEAAEQVRSLTNRITAEAQKKAGKLNQLGQDQLVEQMDQVYAVLDTGKTAVEAA